jgi:hypothetical protein
MDLIIALSTTNECLCIADFHESATIQRAYNGFIIRQRQPPIRENILYSNNFIFTIFGIYIYFI